ncbi:MAG TPA: sigma-70 family RNA polymerase sigma factor [Kofleriaceae bacterium]|nr:sigma-70 family RNA polymerase sigma factor [Kofleriaceae bacterium]HMG53450.1 sigma-70 family RNA polymerase sigma factor [Kofleriaceae bacterium]
MDPDLKLLESWRAGDSRAGQDLFARHFADIYRFFQYKVGADADDLAQRTFMACIDARDRFRGGSSFRTYLFAIARNQLYSFLRRMPRAEHVDFEHTSIADLMPSLGSQLGRARAVERLRLALTTLPAEQQLLLELHYWHELDAEALGEVFESTPGTIRVRLLRARRALRERMDQIDLERAAGIGSSPDRDSQDSLLSALSQPEPVELGQET